VDEARRADARAAAVVALVAFLPFARGALAGASLYFRDLSHHFLPLRRFALEGLRAGEVRFWNPLVHEGVPLSLPALGYPLDLLQLLRPDEAGISLVLAAHVPLAALSLFALARGVGLPRLAAAGGGLVYALGGFLLSTVNLYVQLQAAAWAPLVVLAFLRLLGGAAGRAVPAAAAALAVALSTVGVEIVAQALLAALVLGVAGRGPDLRRGLARSALAVALGLALAAPVLLMVGAQIGGSARGRGFATDVVLAHSVHPFTLVQAVVAGLYGNPSNLAGEWWGDNFFPRGFPHILSLYLGAATVALAAVGALSRASLGARAIALAAAGLVVSLGRWAGLGVVVDALGVLHSFRYPVKAFFTVHLAVALLAALGLAALEGPAARRAWKWLSLVAGGLGAVLAAAPLAATVAAGPAASFAAAFLPPTFPPEARAAVLARVLADAATGGAVALAVAAVAAMALRSSLASRRAAVLVIALVTADLLRAGSGLNPMVTARFFRPSPELASRLGSLRGGRVFTCSVEESPLYYRARSTRGADHEAWSFALLLETLTPSFNVPFDVATALSPDLTMSVPEERVLSPAEASCRDLDAIVPRLRAAAVLRVLAVEPLAHPDLEPDGVLAPGRIAPLAVRVYRLRDPRPRVEASGSARVVEAAFRANGVSLAVEADGAGQVLVRDGWARGWTARVDGEPAALHASGGHLSVPVPAGRHRVEMAYRPPRLGLGLAASALALVAAAALGRRRGRGARAARAN
jgi:hypothetical protein